MKKTVVALVFAFISAHSFCQSIPPVGRCQLNAGSGFSSARFWLYYGVDYCPIKNITLGGEFSYQNFRFGGNIGVGNILYGYFGNGNYHFNSLLGLSPKFDLYTGLSCGYYYWTPKEAINSSEWNLGEQIGGRYFLTKRIGLNMEIRERQSTIDLKLGLTYLL